MAPFELILHECESSEIPTDYTPSISRFHNHGIWVLEHDLMRYQLMVVVGIKKETHIRLVRK